MRDLLDEILGNIRRNKLRTSLTGFAVAWGIFILIFLLGAGNGLLNAIEGNSDEFMANSMNVWGGTTSKPYAGMQSGREIKLDDKDIDITLGPDFEENVDKASSVIYQSSLTVSRGKEYVIKQVSGVSPDYAELNKIKVLYGRFINEMDIKERRKVLVLDSNDARELLGVTGNNEDGLTALQKAAAARQLVGKYVKVNTSMYKVVGILRPNEQNSYSMIHTPITTLRTIYNRGKDIDDYSFSFHGLDSKEENEEFETRLRAKLAVNHQAAPDDTGAIGIWNLFTMTMEMNKSTAIIRIALWIIGILTLLSGIVGVSNIMLISVRERTHEFGIRKAIGASPWSLLKMIISESVIITAFFGYIGMFLGVLANEWLDHISGNMVMDVGLFKQTVFKDPTVGLGVCIGATVLLIVAGTLAGLAPARRAAKVRPIEALRNE
jgi:putative ABC transport system permease protein